MPRGIPNSKLPPGKEAQQLLAAMAEIKERLAVERTRDGQRKRLRAMLGRLTLLSRKDATQIVVDVLGVRGKAAKPVTSKHAARATGKTKARVNGAGRHAARP